MRVESVGIKAGPAFSWWLGRNEFSSLKSKGLPHRYRPRQRSCCQRLVVAVGNECNSAAVSRADTVMAMRIEYSIVRVVGAASCHNNSGTGHEYCYRVGTSNHTVNS